VGRLFCELFAAENLWGARLLSPTLGRCDLDAPAPLCRVGFVLQDAGGAVMPMGAGMAVTREAGAWKFVGTADPIAIHASATVQRDRRVDGGSVVDRYMRALAFEIAARPGLACARVDQPATGGGVTTLAWYKRFSDDAPRLSLWTADPHSNTRSLDKDSGHLRSRDDTWLALPEGTEGDEVVRHFFRAGRSVQVSLFADMACTVPYEVAGRSRFDIDVEGVPPIWAALPALGWPELEDTSAAQLAGLTVAPGGSAAWAPRWRFPLGPLGLGEGSLCGDRATCGDGGEGRLAEFRVRPGATTVDVTVQGRSAGLGAQDPRTLALFGRLPEGVAMQANFQACPARASGRPCDE
jgi:hypothetical protein